MTFTRANLVITTYCNRRCPECAAGMGIWRPETHTTEAEIREAGRLMQGLASVRVTGGEPSFHPQFREVQGWVRESFAPERVEVESNGYGFDRFPDAFLGYDLVIGSMYADDQGGGASNRDAVLRMGHWLAAEGGTPFFCADVPHVSRSRRGAGGPCERGDRDLLVISDGRLFPCCVGAGIEGAPSIPITEDWQARLEETPMPCSDCWFSP